MSPYRLAEPVAKRYGISVRTLHRWCEEGRVPHRKLPRVRRLLFTPEHLDAFDAGAELETITTPGGGRIVQPKGQT